MAENFGPGVTRTLTAIAEQFTTVVWQADKPPLDSELNLMSQVDWENLSQMVRAQVHSGFFLDPTRCDADFVTDLLYSNQFVLAQPATVSGVPEQSPVLFAAVNGWVIPIAGSYLPEGGSGESVANRVRLFPPPSSDSRTDFVFLEVWRAMVAPNPSTANKPSPGKLWKYGNTQYGGTNLDDEIEDPSVGYETTQRVQLQYRIRVVGSGDGLGTSVDLKTFPDGLTDPTVLGQGAALSPVAGMFFTNMRTELGDPSLWRAGDGDPSNALGTVDGYVYAVPICAVFRRNTTPFTAIAAGGTPNQNGGDTRTPSAVSASDARALMQATLTNYLSAGAVGWVRITNYFTSALDDPNLFPVGTLRRYLVVGEGTESEIIAIDQNTDPAGHPDYIFINLIGRGRAGTMARSHPAGTSVSLYTSRPDGLYSDQIAPTDILDMRRSINFGDWDYTRLIQKGVAALAQNNLRTTFKTSGTGGGTVGPVTTEVSIFTATAPAPTYTGPVDGPNAIRTVWSDSAALQSDVTVILNDQASLNPNHTTATTFDTLSAGASWAMGADFQPNGFLNHGTSPVQGWANGSVVFVDIGGIDGNSGARRGLLNGQKAVRFLSPREMWQVTDSYSGGNELGTHHPWQLRFVGGVDNNTWDPTACPTANPNNDANAYRAGFITAPAMGWGTYNHPGHMFPMYSTNFEEPFIVLGGVLRSDLRFTGVVADSTTLINVGGPPPTQFEVNFPSINWDIYGLSLGRDQKDLRSYLTNDGGDFTGRSSRLYLVIYGDQQFRDNNGAFQVIGAGTSAVFGGSYTENVSTDTNNLVVRPLSRDFDTFQNSTNTVTIEFRSQDIYAEDDNGSANPPQGVAVVLTNLQGTEDVYADNLPWAQVDANYALLDDGTRLYPITSKAVLTMDLLWSPNRGASQRVPDQVFRFGVQSPPVSFVRSPVVKRDPVFVSDTGYPSGDVVFETNHVQLWNRLPSSGMYGPYALYAGTLSPYGGAVVGLTEQDRESELFVDPGSKTALFHPFQKKTLILKGLDIVDAAPGPSLIGDLNYPAGYGGFLKDGHGLFATGVTEGYVVPPEFMPRFGRQDIPYHFYTGSSDPIYPGINHLFLDQPGTLADVFNIVGGVDNLGAAFVRSILFDTALVPYGIAGTTGGVPHASYGARKQHLTEVVSSDLGEGMWGVELPPYLGIARLYGVYERSDFLAHCDGTNVGAFLNNDRATMITGTGGTPPTNLLRTDATKQTLFIRQGGASDVTGSGYSHTYLVPDSAINITLIPSYIPGNVFNDFDYVVECVVFGFGEGFIDQNSFVLARLHDGTGTEINTASNLELGGVDMVLPAPSPTVTTPYEVYNRTVYQGDPYMTRDGATIQTADYGTRYGQIAQSDAQFLSWTVTPQSEVQCPNARALEVLATMDFYTTLGTGKIGGELFMNTVTDCGCITPSAGVNFYGARIPNSLSYPPGSYPWVIVPRVFSAGQNNNITHASAKIQILDHATATSNVLTVTFFVSSQGYYQNFTVPFGAPETTNEEMAQNLADKINTTSSRFYYAQAAGPVVTVYARELGSLGNSNAVSLRLGTAANLLSVATVQTASNLPRASTNFAGGVDAPVNAGNGNSIVSLTGMTERLPLGILVSDSDFLAENILGDGATSLRSYIGSLRAEYADVPLTHDGFEYSRFLGEPGTELSLCDGAVLQYIPYTPSTPTGTKKYRIFRGGGATFVLSGTAPGGPVTWVSDSFSASVQPVLKGAALACKAMLVRNYHEDAFGVSNTRTEGDELQMVILTQAVYGTPTTTMDGVTLSGVISPTGYGQGYAAADRYLLPGRPMDRGRTRVAPDPATTPAPYYPY